MGNPWVNDNHVVFVQDAFDPEKPGGGRVVREGQEDPCPDDRSVITVSEAENKTDHWNRIDPLASRSSASGKLCFPIFKASNLTRLNSPFLKLMRLIV